MANQFDRRRAAGNTGARAFPPHKPDPRDMSREFVDEYAAPISPQDQQLLDQNYTARTQGAPFVLGATPSADPGEAMRPRSQLLEALIARSRATPRGRQRVSEGQAFGQQLSALDSGHDAMMADAQQNDEGSMMAGAMPKDRAALIAALMQKGLR